MQLRRSGGAAGFTVPELLVAVLTGLLLIATVGSFTSFQMHRMDDQLRLNRLQMSVRNVMDLFTREVRRAGGNPTCTAGITALADARLDRLQLLSDLNADGAVDGPGERVTYRYRNDDLTLERSGNLGTDKLLKGISLSGSRLRYFDAAGTELLPGSGGLGAAQRDQVRRVRIELVATQAAADPGVPPIRAELANDIELRNRYFGNAIACP